MLFVLSIFFAQFSALENLSESLLFNKARIEISGIRNSKGHILIALFKSADGFPDKREHAFITKRIPSQLGSLFLDLPDIPAGTYAFAIIHDENDNLKLDTGFLGIPKEGFCFSRQAMGSFGPPSFKEASFTIPASGENQKVKMSYW